MLGYTFYVYSFILCIFVSFLSGWKDLTTHPGPWSQKNKFRQIYSEKNVVHTDF